MASPPRHHPHGITSRRGRVFVNDCYYSYLPLLPYPCSNSCMLRTHVLVRCVLLQFTLYFETSYVNTSPLSSL